MALDAILPLQPSIVIVSAQRGQGRNPGTAKTKQVTTYEEYEAIQKRRVGTISVRVESQIPTVIVATAVDAVNWQFDIAKGANLLAIHIEGTRAPTMSGVPANIPIIVRSEDYGDRDTAGRITKLDNTKRNLRHVDRFFESYNGSVVTLIADGVLNSVTVNDATQNPKTQPLPQ